MHGWPKTGSSGMPDGFNISLGFIHFVINHAWLYKWRFHWILYQYAIVNMFYFLTKLDSSMVCSSCYLSVFREMPFDFKGGGAIDYLRSTFLSCLYRNKLFFELWVCMSLCVHIHRRSVVKTNLQKSQTNKHFLRMFSAPRGSTKIKLLFQSYMARNYTVPWVVLFVSIFCSSYGDTMKFLIMAQGSFY